jgi:2-oxoglutarate dehydrogenase E2 component (dihydrolipoamide succinyltransferase)
VLDEKRCSMKQQIEVPTIGESVSSGLLTAWLKNDGAYVSEGEDLFELETDKATMAVPATVSGVLSISVDPDTEVEVGQAVGTIDTEAEVPADEKEASEAGEGSPGESAVAAAAEKDSGQDSLSPAVRRLIEENKLDPAQVRGSGKGGRLTKEDVLSHLRGSQAPDKGAGIGPGTSRAPAVPPAPSRGERQTRKRMSNLRRTIAGHLVESKQNAAHLTTFNEMDMSAVMGMRKDYREDFEKKHGVRLGLMSFFVKAAVRALQTFPTVNAYLEGEEIVYNNFYDIGVAVSTERGLVVPVIRDADRRSFAELETMIVDLATRARDRKLGVDEMTGGTFTITNGGVFGSLLSTPIPNPPQTAVLGMHSIQKRPVVVDDEIVVRPMMYVALTYDHRLIDGREAVSFLVKMKNLVEDPNQMLLDL